MSNMKLDLETLSTVPDDPPAAGPERALDPPAMGRRFPDAGAGDGAIAATPEPVLAAALTMP
jgi:hypothetical protein